MVKMTKFDKPEPASFTTQFPMRCTGCGDTHAAGTSATYQGADNALVAIECIGLEPGDRTESLPFHEDDIPEALSEEERAAARARMCTVCWMVLPASGVCGTCF